ncbi:hypothetical protein V8C44DRAFT_331733 [Trichoderma aethiopicum]
MRDVISPSGNLRTKYISGYRRCQTCINPLRHAWPAAVTFVMTGKYCDQPLLHPRISQCSYDSVKRDYAEGPPFCLISERQDPTSHGTANGGHTTTHMDLSCYLPNDHLEKITSTQYLRHCVTSAASFKATLSAPACCATPELQLAMVIWLKSHFPCCKSGGLSTGSTVIAFR